MTIPCLCLLSCFFRILIAVGSKQSREPQKESVNNRVSYRFYLLSILDYEEGETIFVGKIHLEKSIFLNLFFRDDPNSRHVSLDIGSEKPRADYAGCTGHPVFCNRLYGVRQSEVNSRHSTSSRGVPVCSPKGNGETEGVSCEE